MRSSGGKYFAEVVIGVDRLAGLERSHAVMDEVERVVEHELGGPAEVSVHAEPLAADERPSERVVAAALRVPGVIEVHNATVLMRRAAGPSRCTRASMPDSRCEEAAASRSGCAPRSAARPAPPTSTSISSRTRRA